MNKLIKYNDTKEISAAEFQRQCFNELLDFFKQVRIYESQSTGYIKREVTDLLVYYTIDMLYQLSLQRYEEVKKIPTVDGKIPDMSAIIEKIYDNPTNALNLLDNYLDFANIRKNYLNSFDAINDKKDSIKIYASKNSVFIENSDDELPTDIKLEKSLNDTIANKKFLSNVMRICKISRELDKDLSDVETNAVYGAYNMIQKGTTLDFSFCPIASSGFRKKRHTLIFVTDPGDDHIRTTARYKETIDGVAVHVEHIDRGTEENKEIMEPYRLPSAIGAAKVRLHISDSVPVTAFIGRPVFENPTSIENKSLPVSNAYFEIDKLKSVHMSASACSTMFQNGISDCKIAIERMYFSDAVEFMRCVVGNVLRIKGVQTLAAAFNLNTVYYDDKYQGKIGEAKKLDDPWEIAKTAIAVAIDGEFDRVTWDGAGHGFSKIPIIKQLSHAQFTELVHTAHEKGLQTYFSAGLNAVDVEPCIYTGVDGLGIGTSLHYKPTDPESDMAMGSFDIKEIKKVLDARNKAEQTVKGQGAALLARMDRLYFEKSILSAEDELRKKLYLAVKAGDENTISSILSNKSTERIRGIHFETENPLIERAKRKLLFLKIDHATSPIIERLENAVLNNDLDSIHHIFEIEKSEQENN